MGELDQLLAANQPLLDAFKATLQGWRAGLRQRFDDGETARVLVRDSTDFIDAVLQRAWTAHMPPDAGACLIAVGGYGRRELHPASDIDVLILTTHDPRRLAEHIEPLVIFLWDIGLEIGHAVRSLEQCADEARANISVMTNLIESRPIAGRRQLFDEICTITGPDRMWSSRAFFAHKLDEQNARHAKFDDSGQRLEPNIKESPGGLRDIQTIGWVARRHFGMDTMQTMIRTGFMTDHECRQIKQGEEYLWQVRFALHLITGRHEDRLLFEHQRELARQFGYPEDASNLAVERFMQEYYRTVVQMQRLNEMLLQLFQEVILMGNRLGDPVPVNRRFQTRGGYLEVVNAGTFARYPLAMLEMFHILQQQPQIKGVRASTIRLVRAHRHLIDRNLRNDIRARTLFIEIFRHPDGLTHALRRMHRYGILSHYVPGFDAIVGLMQFDLFHIYTVDEHILMVMRNARRFALAKHADECPRCNDVFARLPKPELLYLACMFHDIAKGRGGDHSMLGSADARNFCRQHDLSSMDSDLVAWLVEKHLVMSHIAQHQDIDDPEVVQAFATMIGAPTRLDYLYLLTVADLRGTNPTLWNSWKSSLLDRLHSLTAKALARGLDQPQHEDEVIGKRQSKARKLLAQHGFDDQQVNLLWMSLNTEYFLQNEVDAIVWHTEHLWPPGRTIGRTNVDLRNDKANRCSELFIYGPGRNGLFALITSLIDHIGLNVLSARIHITEAGLSIHSYLVLEEDGSQIEADERLDDIKQFLEEVLNSSATPTGTVRMPRRLKHFQTASEITFEQDEHRAVTLLKLKTSDRPGLLSLVGQAFAEHDLRLRGARIATAGAEAQDAFQITGHDNQPVIDPRELDKIAESIKRNLDG